MPRAISFVAAVCGLLAAAGAAARSADEPVDGHWELVKLVAMNRHGHRAPNLPFWTLCPKERAHVDVYGTGPEDLTRVGFDEEFRCGRFLRREYGDFVSAEYDRTRHFVQAVGEPRTLQSALAIDEGLWGKPTGPAARLPHRPQLVPVFSDLQQHEFLINDIPCHGHTGADTKAWLRDAGGKIAREPKNAHALRRLQELCGTPASATKTVSYDMFVKLLIDGIIFEHDFGIAPLGGKVPADLFFTLRNLSHSFLLGKLYSTDEQKTYAAAEFPHYLTKTLRLAAGGPGALPARTKSEFDDNEPLALSTKFNLFVVHREELYALKYFLGLEYRCEGMARYEVPAGTTFLFEVRRPKGCAPADKKKCPVRLYPRIWTPREGLIKVTSRFCKGGVFCTQEELDAIYTKRTDRTGTWDKICGFKRPAA